MQYLMLKWTIFRPSEFLRSFLHFSYIFQQFQKNGILYSTTWNDLLPAAKEMKVEGQEETQERIWGCRHFKFKYVKRLLCES